ncbi:TonB-dependent receptor [Adhaeribacter soli]|uniref:TonB-dependent receptor plug domain-containing protein n=1 Tax=Adhaeribacter soli TaxID=2607655 RepID=A0A5N1IK47_9BACT|nr:TonB-dependent receptor [Adhaeribacter soli]KAA9325649.1 TonB-dependent receptor plug domain-containing protein [Adhaeribacter soli]
MKQFLLTILLAAFSFTAAYSQLTQTVRGTISDADTGTPLTGVTVLVKSAGPVKGTITDAEGKYRLENIPTGRITLQLSYLGYEAITVPDVVVNSGKEAILNLTMQESALSFDEVVVTNTKKNGEPVNDMALVSSRSISMEESNRYAGGFNDPSKILSNFAGVARTQDGRNNDIIVRGNSPKYVQWRLEGVQITNPNHFADQGGMGGGVNALNNSLLATSDFYTGAFSPEYGNVLSGVYDLKLRAGNNEKFEAALGIGIIGTDLTVEGPFRKGYGGSYLLNYRYSTASVLKDVGVIEAKGIPKFQDATLKVVLPTARFGTFSLFSLGGKSGFEAEDVSPIDINTPGDRTMRGDISEDMKSGAHLLNVGVNHTMPITSESFIQTNITYSKEGINDQVFESKRIQVLNGEGGVVRDSVVNNMLNFNSRLMKSVYRGAVSYTNKLNARNKIVLGANYNLFAYNYNQSQFADDAANRFTLMDFKENVGTLGSFVSWKLRLNEHVTVVSGLHNMNVLLNKNSTLEPRVAVKWRLTNGNAFHAGYGLHSTMESIHNYFAKVPQTDGRVMEPNKDLELLKAHHFVIGYEKLLTDQLVLKGEVYCQKLYNLPVENDLNSAFATINENLDFKYTDLVNKGKGRNYGVEVSLEKYFSNNYYYLVNGSVYTSKYTALDGKERNTAFNNNYLANMLVGNEFVKLGKKQNQTLGLNVRALLDGGKKIIPLLRDSNGNIAVNPSGNQYWDYDKAYDKSLGSVYMVTVSASYKWNKLKTTHELFLNLDNVTNSQGKLTEFYDETQPNSVGYTTQFGLFPNLMYRLYL